MSETMSTVLKLAAAVILIAGLAWGGSWAMSRFSTDSQKMVEPGTKAEKSADVFKKQ